ncbi:hypothetical protein F2Q69_00026001 [Brassica cretica]|uniref:Protein kinase domain-containing protein n=1 Tax=Brassica cretica TaxID=69181 RepID=A0A8S9S5X4_BRACR|nr:hypothetical protein F2Q69_00026001 [Brassica cretica]
MHKTVVRCILSRSHHLLIQFSTNSSLNRSLLDTVSTCSRYLTSRFISTPPPDEMYGFDEPFSPNEPREVAARGGGGGSFDFDFDFDFACRCSDQCISSLTHRDLYLQEETMRMCKWMCCTCQIQDSHEEEHLKSSHQHHHSDANHKNPKPPALAKPEVRKEPLPIEVPALSLDEVKEKTDNFGSKSLIGEGSYGRVALCVQYEAEFRPNMSIVVKALQPLLKPPPPAAAPSS